MSGEMRKDMGLMGLVAVCKGCERGEREEDIQDDIPVSALGR